MKTPVKVDIEKILDQFESSVSNAFKSALSDAANGAPLPLAFDEENKKEFYEAFSSYKYGDSSMSGRSYADDLYKTVLYFRLQLQRDDDLYNKSRELHSALAQIEKDPHTDAELSDGMRYAIDRITQRGGLGPFKQSYVLENIMIDLYYDAIKSLSTIKFIEDNKREQAKSKMSDVPIIPPGYVMSTFIPSDAASIPMKSVTVLQQLN